MGREQGDERSINQSSEHIGVKSFVSPTILTTRSIEINAVVIRKRDDCLFPVSHPARFEAISARFATTVLSTNVGNFDLKKDLDSVLNFGFRREGINLERVGVVPFGQVSRLLSDERAEDHLVGFEFWPRAYVSGGVSEGDHFGLAFYSGWGSDEGGSATDLFLDTFLQGRQRLAGEHEVALLEDIVGVEVSHRGNLNAFDVPG